MQKPVLPKTQLFVVTVVISLGVAAMAASPLGITQGRLSACPDSPNCVSSDEASDARRIAPWRLAGDPARAWQLLQEVLARWPRATVVVRRADYLHVEFRSRLFGFVDDAEFHLRPADSLIAVRSAARIGYSDLGVNRKRLEDLRQELVRLGAVK
jgi:uncharacterized protein (DUF1499 family)